MATDIYVKADTGSDGGEGTQGSPYEHISFALGRIANPLTDVTTIHLTSNGTAFTETNGIVSFRNIRLGAEGAKLIIQADDYVDSSWVLWNENYYENGTNPYNGEVPLNITTNRPASLEIRFEFIDCEGIELRGLHFNPNDDGEEMNIKAEGFNRDIVFKYCSFMCADMGLIISGPSMISFEMCYFMGNVYTLTALNGATVSLDGDNLFANPILGAIRAIDRASVSVNPWQYGPTRYYTTTIQTSTVHKEEYHAILLQDASSLRVPYDPMMPLDVYNGKVVIHHEGAKLPENYYGVKLASKSLLSGADDFEFTMKNLKGETVEMPAEQQIMIGEGQDVTVVD
ncbi:MAG TPA: hypothetical protein PKW95_06310 [bacterium]|nr:hypothetical protein [bacterium]